MEIWREPRQSQQKSSFGDASKHFKLGGFPIAFFQYKFFYKKATKSHPKRVQKGVSGKKKLARVRPGGSESFDLIRTEME